MLCNKRSRHSERPVHLSQRDEDVFLRHSPTLLDGKFPISCGAIGLEEKQSPTSLVGPYGAMGPQDGPERNINRSFSEMKLEKQGKDHNSLTPAPNTALGSTQERRQVHRDTNAVSSKRSGVHASCSETRKVIVSPTHHKVLEVVTSTAEHAAHCVMSCERHRQHGAHGVNMETREEDAAVQTHSVAWT
ncbi:hypothetical protein MJT46_001868 [Ovis ammon polii x Ovis aries]|nr:hypothetical protein MJT46_001868 [Ovis ammon polii x Ovis aries]